MYALKMNCFIKNAKSYPRIVLMFLLLSHSLVCLAQQEGDDTAQQVNQIDELLVLGAPELALKVLQKKQPDLLESNWSDWLLWEKKHIQLLQQLQHWPQVIERIELMLQKRQHQLQSSENTIDQQEIVWFDTQRINSLLKLSHNSQALGLLQKLLWNNGAITESNNIEMWRRLVIQCYMQMDKLEDAQRAMRRYQQDYSSSNNDDLAWRVLQSQLLMRTNRYQEVIRLLMPVKNHQQQALLYLAKLSADRDSIDEIKKQLKKPYTKKDKKTDFQYVYDYVALKIAIVENDLALKIQYIEDFLASRKLKKLEQLFSDAGKYISADGLWQDYHDYGYALANRFKLLRGDDAGWYLKADQLAKKSSIQARALYAVLAFTAAEKSQRWLALENLTNLLDKNKQGIEVIDALFMQSSKITDINVIPASIRYRLVDYALSKADLSKAAQLMSALQHAPEGEDAFAWGLRRSRILIMGNEFQQGAEVLNQLLKNRRELTETQTDQYMQVVFDLQAIEQHELALRAFEVLERLGLTGKLQREIAFWKAESYQALEQYEKAAQFFLKSAIALDDKYDPWYHTSSYKAAESLTQAGLINDARRQYIKLLRITKNAARKSVIKQKLQQLHLLKRNPDTQNK